MGLRLFDYLVLGDGDAWTSLRDERRVRFHSLGEDMPIPGDDRRARVEPKYRNPDPPHQTWSGRGKMARWLREKLEADGHPSDFRGFQPQRGDSRQPARVLNESPCYSSRPSGAFSP